MGEGFGQRAVWGIGAVLAATIGALAVGGDAQTAVLALGGGVAAVLLAASRNAVPAPAPATADAEPLLAPILDAVAEPVLLIADGTVAIANRAARALLGPHIVGEDARVAIRHPAATERLATVSVDERPVELVGLGQLDQRWAMRVAAVGGGRRLVHLTDRTDAYAAERMRVDFVANASHELRTPLAAVLGFIETLEEAGEEADTRARFLGIMGAEAQRMQRLVEDLISLSRIEAEKYRAPADAVDLSDLIDEVQAELAGTTPRTADLAVMAEPGVSLVTGDRAQLSQMLHNLVGNALKYGRAGTPVTVTLGREGALVRLAVADRGEGIAPEHLPRLTERFYRVDTGRSRSLGGTGLGLAIVKHIVERHRGRLDIASRAGEGTTVTVTLPPRAPEAATALSSSGHAGSAGQVR